MWGSFCDIVSKDLLLAFEAVDSDMCKVRNRYFLQHAKSWLSLHNIALSVYSENPPMTKEIFVSYFTAGSGGNWRFGFDETSQTKRLFTISSKTAPCISFGLNEFWKSIENHNRCNEREIGKLKDLLHHKKIRDTSSRRNQTDVRLRSYSRSCSVDVFFAFVTVLVFLFLFL